MQQNNKETNVNTFNGYINKVTCKINCIMKISIIGCALSIIMLVIAARGAMVPVDGIM
jgi:hypothetical protein